MKTTVRLFVCLCALLRVVASEETLQSFHVNHGRADYGILLRQQTEGEFKDLFYFVVTLPHHVRLGRWSDSDLSLLVFYETGEPETVDSAGVMTVSMAGGSFAQTFFFLRAAPKKAVFRMKQLGFGLICEELP
jgi:hypothetical protein